MSLEDTRFEIDVCNNQSGIEVDTVVLQEALTVALNAEGVTAAVLSVTVVDNDAIHKLNKQHLSHDYPTDVISFQLEWTSELADSPPLIDQQRSDGATIEGEIVVSAEYAKGSAEQLGWSTQSELILYTIHGMLHICGYDDQCQDELEIMRRREQAILGLMSLKVPYSDPESGNSALGHSSLSEDVE